MPVYSYGTQPQMQYQTPPFAPAPDASGCLPVPEGQPSAIQPSGAIVEGYWPLWSTIVLASTAASAYHGYKRNQSVGWALIWGIAGSILPVVTPAIAVAQGFGKREKK